MRLNFPTGSRPCTRARSSLTIVRAASVPSVVLADGTRIALSKTPVSIGSSSSSTIRLLSEHVLPEHAKIEWKSGRVFCTALQSNPQDDPMTQSNVWIDGVRIISGVSYIVAPGCKICFGLPDIEGITVDFEEAATNDELMSLLVQGMVSGASPEVKEKMNDF